MRDDVRAVWLLMLLDNPIMEFSQAIRALKEATCCGSLSSRWLDAHLFISNIYFSLQGKGFFSSWKKARIDERVSLSAAGDGYIAKIAAAILELLSLRKDQEAAHKVILSQG
ncbi:unnamed protein product [Brassica oleracea]